MGKDSEGSVRGLIEILIWNLPVETEKNHEELQSG
jgi:hypothetical protein